MQFLSARRIVGALAAIMLTSSTAFGGAWTIPSGNTDTLGGPLSFSYSNGGDVNGLFNDPFIFGDAFFFTTAFTASAANGTQASQNDTVSVDILADPGLKFSSVSVTASGSYAIDTVGTVDVNALLSMSENTGLQRTFSDALATDVAFPTSTPTGGVGVTYNGSALVDVEFVFPVPSDDIHISLTNDVLAIAGPNGSASVNIQFQDLQIGFNVIPEPASASLLLVGGLFATVARRRRRRC